MPHKTVEIVTAPGNDMVVQLKGNQPSLFQRFTTTYPSPPPVDRHHRHELGRQGRMERRTTRVWSLPPGAGPEPWHDHFRTLIEVQRHPEGFQTRHKHWRERQETAY